MNIVKLGPPDPVWNRMIATGEWWLRVWFLENDQVEHLRTWQFERQDLVAAVDAFKTVYPKGIAKALLNHDWTPSESTPIEEIWRREDQASLVVNLFARTSLLPPVDFLGLGVDLGHVFGTRVDKDLRRRLTEPKWARGADLEVQVWANALRAGWGVTKLDKGQSEGKRHDFLIAVPGRPDAAVEVKALDPSDDAILSYRLHMENSPMFSRGSVPDDRTVCVQMKEELRVAVADPSRHAWLKKQIPAAMRALGRAFEDLASKGFSFGEWPAMGGGMLAVVPRTEGLGSVTFSLGDEKASEKQAGRILIPLEKAARKPRRSGIPSLAFIHIPRLSETLVREAVEDDLTRRPDKYQNLDGFIIRTVRQVVDDGFPPYEEWRAWARPTAWGNISADDLNVLGRGLMESRFRLSLPRWVARKNESDWSESCR